MSIYSTYWIDFQDIDKIRDIWERLYVGKDMTYHQSYGWYKMLTKFTPKGRGISSELWVVEKDNIPVLIAPLWIIYKSRGFANPKGVYIIGRNSFTDYLNLIYDSFDTEVFLKLVEGVSRKYDKKFKWHFELLKESSELYKCLIQFKDLGRCKFNSVHSGSCALLVLPKTIDEYEKSLSKSTRQNIRTAHNRAQKENIQFEINFDDKEVDLIECKRIREAWRCAHKARDKSMISWKGHLYLTLKHYLNDVFQIKFPKFIPFIDDENSNMLTVKCGEDIAAFFNYGYDSVHNQILVMTAGVNQKYVRYSPGILGMKSMLDHLIGNENIDSIDFTRGNESYKYKLGCKPNDICSIVVSF